MIKKLIFFIILIQFVNCVPRKNSKYVLNDSTYITKAKFFNIESKNGLYIYHFKTDSIEGVFTKQIDSNFINKNYQKIKLNKTYTLVLKKNIQYASCVTTEEIETTYIENGIVIWTPGMKSKYFTDCQNVENIQINPRFTLLKYINPVNHN